MRENKKIKQNVCYKLPLELVAASAIFWNASK